MLVQPAIAWLVEVCHSLPAAANFSLAEGSSRQRHLIPCTAQGEGSDRSSGTTSGADMASYAGEQCGCVPCCIWGCTSRHMYLQSNSRWQHCLSHTCCPTMQHDHRPVCKPQAPADQASRMPPVGAESRPSERSAEEPESSPTSSSSAGGAQPSESDVEGGVGADAVMERRVDDPSVGGIAS